MAAINIRNVDPGLLKAIKLAAVHANLTQKEWVIRVLSEAVEKPSEAMRAMRQNS